MWSWLQSNAQVVSAAASLAMLVVWAAYLQLIYSSYRHSRRSMILINRGAGTSLDASCVVSNMGEEPIYLEAVRLSLDGEEAPRLVSLNDLDVAVPTETDRRARWLQGPLGSSEMIDIGSFGSIIKRSIGSVRHGDKSDGQPHLDGRVITIVVVATMTSEERVVAATRSFRIAGSGSDTRLHPCGARTHQIRSGRARKEIEDHLEREIQKEWEQEAS